MPSFAETRLETERLRLRPLRATDAPALFAIFSDPDVMRFWSTPPWTNLEDARASIADDVAAPAGGTHLRLGVETRDDARLIGTCVLFNLAAPSRRAEIGYALARAAWGRGYMHEALRALLTHGFEALDLNRIEADIDPRNEASARCLERLGFEREGLLRERWIVSGEISDSSLYGLLRRDWESGEHARPDTGGAGRRRAPSPAPGDPTGGPVDSKKARGS